MYNLLHFLLFFYLLWYNIYCIKLNPTYLISGGVDKTNTLTDKFNMKLLFVYVDENNAQAYNYTTNDTYYLVKK